MRWTRLTVPRSSLRFIGGFRGCCPRRFSVSARFELSGQPHDGRSQFDADARSRAKNPNAQANSRKVGGSGIEVEATNVTWAVSPLKTFKGELGSAETNIVPVNIEG